MAYDENGNKIDGRKNNKGHVGKAGRKPKTAHSEMIDMLAEADKYIIPIIIEKAKTGDKDWVKMWNSYRFGNPTAMGKDSSSGAGSISHNELVDKLRYDFEDDDENFFDED